MRQEQDKKGINLRGPRQRSEPAGFLHVRQCCSLAMSELANGSGAQWRRKIWKAIRRLHGPYSGGAVGASVTGKLFEAWDACSPTRFGKPFEDLSDEQVAQLAHALAGFIVAFLLEEGGKGRRSTE